MNLSMIRILILKDWYLHRWMILGALLSGVAALGIVCLGGQAAFMIGLILLLSALIAAGAQLSVGMIVNERKEQTLPFVMSLPISYREYTSAKLLGTLLIFLLPWLVLVLGSFALFIVPHGIPHGLFPFAAIMSVEILASTCLSICVAVVTESQAWTVSSIMVGNVGLDIFGYLIAHLSSIAKGIYGPAVMWSTTATTLLLVELGVIISLFGCTFFLQSRKKDFL